MMRLDVDPYPIIKMRSMNQSSLLLKINEEINQLSKEIFSIERIFESRTRKYFDNTEELGDQNGIILKCKLLDKSNPILPPLRLYISTFYPEQSPEILSLTKTTPPRLEFSGNKNLCLEELDRNSVYRWSSIFRTNFIDICLLSI